MELNVLNAGGKSAGTVAVSDAVFARDFNEALVHQVVTAYLAGGRAGTRAQKTRAEVSGGGRKPWKQKGTGRARAGTIRSPLWRGGGRTFAATPADHSQKINKQMYRSALRVILSELLRQERLVVVEGLTIDQPKTRELAAKLKAFGATNALIITDMDDNKLQLASRNLPYVEVRSATEIDPVGLVKFEKVFITAAAVKQLGERLA